MVTELFTFNENEEFLGSLFIISWISTTIIGKDNICITTVVLKSSRN